MAVDDQDIFGKIDALLEKRAGFVKGEANSGDDFPVLTEVVNPHPANPFFQDRRCGERRQGVERRQADRRQGAATWPNIPNAGLSEEQFERFLARFERKLEDLFIRQQLRLEEALRRALQEGGRISGGGSPDSL